MSRSIAILPIGNVNMKTGKNEMFGTVWSCWEEDVTAHNMLVKLANGKMIVTHTAGEGQKVGHVAEYRHDQTNRSYGKGTVIACQPHTKEGLMNLGAHAGTASLKMATYK